MINFNCPNCGGLLTPNNKGELVCSYCNRKSYFSDAEIKDYLSFRTQLLQYVAAENDRNAAKLNESIYTNTTKKSFVGKKKESIMINYLFEYIEDGVEIYICLNTMVFVFKPSLLYLELDMRQNLDSIQYPAADIKKLNKYIPSIAMRVELEDGSVLVAIGKPENSFPLSVFGCLNPRHIAWIVSRMENICCLFAYNNMTHNGLSLQNIFINPRTHEAFFYGGWWKATRPATSNDLQAIRIIGKQLLSPSDETPTLFTDFLNSHPKTNAYCDFQYWDTVIEHGFGGHNFVKFE